MLKGIGTVLAKRVLKEKEEADKSTFFKEIREDEIKEDKSKKDGFFEGGK